MAITLSNANGTLPGSVGALYIATNPGPAWVNLTNRSGSTRTVNVYLNKGGTRSLLTPQNLSLLTGEAWPSARPYGPIILAAGNSIDGDASGVNVDFSVSCMEKS